jgi:predicted ATPase/DNA-binding winged helix-turn-helix (wHTH) protein
MLSSLVLALHMSKRTVIRTRKYSMSTPTHRRFGSCDPAGLGDSNSQRTIGETHHAGDDQLVAFGPFLLDRATCTLSKGGSPIRVRSRAMGILLALVEKAGQVVSNRELLQRVWPNVVVEPGTVRVHVAQLRRVLRKVDPDNDYVHNVTGQGYRFVAPVVRQRRRADAAVIQLFGHTQQKAPASLPALLKGNLPRPLTSVVGLDTVKSELLALLDSKRLITVTGPGGIGKTTAAIVCATAAAQTGIGSILFLDLAPITGTEQIWAQLGEMLGVAITGADLHSQILAGLAKQDLLLVLDSCEHVIDGAARFAESVLRVCPQVRILATGREPLRVSAEVVHELAGLALPDSQQPSSREALLRHPAIQLFVDRAGTEFDEQELWLVAQICRRVAGNPLAIEIAAAQCRWVGLTALAVELDDEMYLSMEGQRTSHRRQQTLRASFDWSYDLLTAEERAILQRLSELPGCFGVDVAVSLLATEQLPRRVIVKALLDLARKSLLVRDVSGLDVTYGMNSLVRAYVRSRVLHAQEFSSRTDIQSHIALETGVESSHRFVGLWQSARSDRMQ